MSVEVMSAVWRLDLPQNKKLVLLAIADHANDDGIAWPSQGRIAWKTGYKRRNIKRILDELIEDGFLTVMRLGRGRGNSTVHQLTLQNAPRLSEYNADDYYVPFKEKVSVATPNGVKGALGGEKVHSEVIKGVLANAPEPSLEPSLEPSYSASKSDADPGVISAGEVIDLPKAKTPSKDNGKNKLRGDLEQYFAEISNIPLPKCETKTQKTKAAVRWWNPLAEILEMTDWNLTQAQSLVNTAYKQMKKDELTIAAPQSILSVAISLHADGRVGTNGAVKLRF